jgi:hypothetical protein
VVRQVTDSLNSLPAGAKLREDLLCNSGAVQGDVRKSAKALLIQQGVITPMSVNSHGQTTFAIASASGQPTSYIAGATPPKGVGTAPSTRSTDDVSEIVRRVIEALHAHQLPELREDLLGSLLRDAGATKPDVRKAAKDLLIQQGSIASASVNAHGQKTFTVAQHVSCGVIPPKEAADPAFRAQVRMASDLLRDQGHTEIRSDVLGSLMQDAGAMTASARKALLAALLSVGALTVSSTNEHGQSTYSVRRG